MGLTVANDAVNHVRSDGRTKIGPMFLALLLVTFLSHVIMSWIPLAHFEQMHREMA